MATLEDLSGDEASHVALITQGRSGPINEQAFRDCIRIVQSEYGRKHVSSEDDLLKMRQKMQERKGLKL